MRSLLPLALLLPGAAYAQDPTTDILWYHGNGGTDNGAVNFDNFFSSTVNGNVIIEDDWNAITSLSNYRFVVLAKPLAGMAPIQINDLNTYIANRGILVIIGDHTSDPHDPGIAAMNTMLHELDVNIEFIARTFANPFDPQSGTDCNVGNGYGVAVSSPFINQSTPIAVLNSGDLLVSAPAVLLQDVGYNIANVGQDSANVLARQDLVLVSADSDMFTGNACGEASKEAMWRRIWDLYCDRDQDGSQPGICGGFDCDDTDETIGDSFEWRDLDGDGYGDFAAPAPCEADAVDNSEDCDDSDAGINPDAIEVCDGEDNDCDLEVDTDAEEATSWYTDFDGDGYGRDADVIESCDQPTGRVDNADDCNDGDDEAFPGAQERCGNNEDDDCDGDVDEGCATTQPTGGTGGNTDPKKCGCSSATGLLGGLPLLLIAAGVTRRRERL